MEKASSIGQDRNYKVNIQCHHGKSLSDVPTEGYRSASEFLLDANHRSYRPNDPLIRAYYSGSKPMNVARYRVVNIFLVYAVGSRAEHVLDVIVSLRISMSKYNVST